VTDQTPVTSSRTNRFLALDLFLYIYREENGHSTIHRWNHRALCVEHDKTFCLLTTANISSKGFRTSHRHESLKTVVHIRQGTWKSHVQ